MSPDAGTRWGTLGHSAQTPLKPKQSQGSAICAQLGEDQRETAARTPRDPAEDPARSTYAGSREAPTPTRREQAGHPERVTGTRTQAGFGSPKAPPREITSPDPKVQPSDSDGAAQDPESPGAQGRGGAVRQAGARGRGSGCCLGPPVLPPPSGARGERASYQRPGG